MTDIRNFGPFGLGHFFQEVHRLKLLRKMASPNPDPSAGDLIRQLDSETRKAGFEPVGAHNRGLTSDEFFQSHSRFNSMEDQLTEKIVPDNVTEVFDLMLSTDHYTPTRKVISALMDGFQKKIARRYAPASQGTPLETSSARQHGKTKPTAWKDKDGGFFV